MGAHLAKVIVGSLILNTSYFAIGLVDHRISAMARQRHGNYGFLIDVGRLIGLVILQLCFYLAVGLNEYPAYQRLSLHFMSIAFLAFGTKMSVIGLTGGISCGKSTVIDMIKEKGKDQFKIIDADKIAHDMYDKPEFVAKIFKTFGKEAVSSEDGKTVDRKKLGTIVFSDKAKR